jgi:hypothetical protein
MSRAQTKPTANPEDSNLQQESLEKLVDELMKDQPNKAKVKKLSQQLGMTYSVDQMTQMNTVLSYMNSFYPRPTKVKQLES